MLGIVHGAIEHEVVEPEQFGVRRARIEDLQGGSAEDNARILLEVLEGQRGARRDIVLVNTAAALKAAGIVDSFAQGMEQAAAAIDSGAARARLHAFVEFTQRAAA
jgi:anthranilate phosphoribosyltransferase